MAARRNMRHIFFPRCNSFHCSKSLFSLIIKLYASLTYILPIIGQAKCGNLSNVWDKFSLKDCSFNLAEESETVAQITDTITGYCHEGCWYNLLTLSSPIFIELYSIKSILFLLCLHVQFAVSVQDDPICIWTNVT